MTSSSEDWQWRDGKEAFCAAASSLILFGPVNNTACHPQPRKRVGSLHKCVWPWPWDLACLVLTPSLLASDIPGLQLGPQLLLPVLVAFSFGLSGLVHDHLAAAAELMVNVRTARSCHLVGDS